MKNLLVLAFLFAIANISVAQIITPDDNMPSSGNVNSTVNFGASQQAPIKFNSKEEAFAAPATTGRVFYKPSYFGGASRKPVDGVTRVRRPLEENAVVRMDVVGGIYYVWIIRGTMARFEVNSAGIISDIPYALDECGNTIYELYYVTDVQTQSNQQTIEIEQNQSVRFNSTPVYAQSQTRQIQMPTTYQMETRQYQNPPCNPCLDKQQTEQLNYYSQKANVQALPLSSFTYQQPYDYGFQPKVKTGMPKFVKWVLITAVGIATYSLVANISKNKKENRPTTNDDGTNNGNQVVETLPATIPSGSSSGGQTVGFIQKPVFEQPNLNKQINGIANPNFGVTLQFSFGK